MDKTLGRRPTLGEVLDYYTREDFLRFLLDTVRTRQVVMAIPERLHWEPKWKENGIWGEDAAQLRGVVVSKIQERLPGVGWGDRLDYYPSFHQSIGKRMRREDATSGGDDDGASARQHMSGGQDCIFEADLPTWRESFRDVAAILDRMDDYEVPYRHKFSGHRSLHVVIPAEILPKGYRGKALEGLIQRLIGWSGSQAHRLPKITRMPYSLNEDTGLVCLPIERGGLPRFRPWQANVHLVEVRDVWNEFEPEGDGDGMEDAQARMAAFLDAVKAFESQGEAETSNWIRGVVEGTPRRTFFVPDRAGVLSSYGDRVAAVQGSGPVGAIWGQLGTDGEMSEQALLEGLAHSEPDARWIALEAFLLKGARISLDGVLKLLAQEGEYVWPAAADVLLRFDEDILPHLVQIIEEPMQHQGMVAKASYLLTQGDALRERFLECILRRTARSHRALITAACLAGSIGGDWGGAFRLVESVRTSATLSERDRAGLAALDLMGTMGGWDKREEGRKSEALAELGKDVTELLLAAAGSPQRRFRRGIVSALARLADERSVDLLIHALGDDYSKVRRKAITGLICIGEQAVDPLIEAAASDEIPIRRYAVLCLGHIGALRAKEAILNALDDGEEVVRRQAIRSLKGMATVEDVGRLKEVLRAESFDIGMEAIERMQGIGEEGEQALWTMALEERTPAAAYFIAQQGDPRGREILAEHLATEERREEAAEFLRELGDERCVPVLIERLRTATGWQGVDAAWRLGRFQDPAAIAALIEALSRDDKQVRRGAVRALADVEHPMVVERLIQCLGDGDGKVRSHAVEALSKMGERAKEPLQRALEEQRIQGKHPQRSAWRILRRLGGVKCDA